MIILCLSLVSGSGLFQMLSVYTHTHTHTHTNTQYLNLNYITYAAGAIMLMSIYVCEK